MNLIDSPWDFEFGGPWESLAERGKAPWRPGQPWPNGSIKRKSLPPQLLRPFHRFEIVHMRPGSLIEYSH